jgi:hypothetical protein
LLLRHSIQKYAGGVAKKLKQINGKCRAFGWNGLFGCTAGIVLAIFVQCNILAAMRAVEPRKCAANQANPQFPSGSGGTQGRQS